MERHHSTLEHFRHDETARAPERDWDATAFELDTSALAPQVVSDTSPQLLYDNALPEVHEDTEATTKERTPSHETPRPRLKLILVFTASVLAVAIAIGVGIGIWRHDVHESDGPTTSQPAPSPIAPQNPANTSSPRSTNAVQYVLNDTSLAAIVLPGGDRHMFFQDNNGSIRRAIRSASETSWTISESLNLSSTPKNHTPLAVQLVQSWSGAPPIWLLYVSKSHVLVSTVAQVGSWSPDPDFAANWSTAVDTRSLSLCMLPGAGASNTSSNINQALLFYVNSTGQVSALLQLYQGETLQTQWVDITSQESISLPSEFVEHGGDGGWSTTMYESQPTATFSTPFTSAANFSGDTVGALFHSPNAGTLELVYKVGVSGPGYFGALTPSDQQSNPPQISDYNAMRHSDIATFGSGYFIWINGTQPVAAAAPKSWFPFARLASATYQAMTYLYHQINGTTFAEEQWNDKEFTWGVTEYINVPDLSIQAPTIYQNPEKKARF